MADEKREARELAGWIVVNQDGWVQSLWSIGEGTGDGARTPRLLSKMEAEDLATKWWERWQDEPPDAKVQVCPVYAGAFTSA